MIIYQVECRDSWIFTANTWVANEKEAKKERARLKKEGVPADFIEINKHTLNGDKKEIIKFLNTYANRTETNIK